MKLFATLLVLFFQIAPISAQLNCSELMDNISNFKFDAKFLSTNSMKHKRPRPILLTKNITRKEESSYLGFSVKGNNLALFLKQEKKLSSISSPPYFFKDMILDSVHDSFNSNIEGRFISLIIEVPNVIVKSGIYTKNGLGTKTASDFKNSDISNVFIFNPSTEVFESILR